MANPLGYVGRGTELLYSLDDVNFSTINQLLQFEHSGSKQALVDQTGPQSPGPFTQKIPVQVDSGEIDISGVLNAQDPSYIGLKQMNDGLLPGYFTAVLIDGSEFSFQAFVSEFKAFSVNVKKANRWSAKLTLTGQLVGPFWTTFDVMTFDTGAFDA